MNPMRLYVMRHAQAAEIGACGIARDADRPLTARGRRQARLMAAFLRRHGCRPDGILTSPLARAVETARIVAARLDLARAVAVCRALQPGGNPGALIRRLARRGGGALLLVGHMPELARLAARCAGGGGADLELKKAGLCCLAFRGAAAEGQGELKWLVAPKLPRGILRRRPATGPGRWRRLPGGRLPARQALEARTV